MEIIKKNHFLVFTIALVYILAYLVMLALGFVILAYYPDVAADSEGNLYIGKAYDISVFKDGQVVKSIHVTDNLGKYFFYISDDLLYVERGSSVEILDLSGNSVEVLSNTTLLDLFPDYNTTTADFISQNGDKYYSYSILGRYCISRVSNNGEKSVIFKMPFKDYTFKMLLIVSVFIIIIEVIIVLGKSMKDNPDSKTDKRTRFVDKQNTEWEAHLYKIGGIKTWVPKK